MGWFRVPIQETVAQQLERLKLNWTVSFVARRNGNKKVRRHEQMAKQRVRNDNLKYKSIYYGLYMAWISSDKSILSIYTDMSKIARELVIAPLTRRNFEGHLNKNYSWCSSNAYELESLRYTATTWCNFQFKFQKFLLWKSSSFWYLSVRRVPLWKLSF